MNRNKTIIIITSLVLLTALLLFSWTRTNHIPNSLVETKPNTLSFNPTDYYNNPSDKNNVFDVENLASDLVKVCVKVPNSMNTCDYFDYWTNNRTGEWERLQRDSAGTEGSMFCEYFENWRVAKGMSYTGLHGNITESTVSF